MTSQLLSPAASEEFPDDLPSDEAILVEYLDGELTLHDRQVVEERLAREPELRDMLARLEKSWKYLDLLDRPETDKDLLETTLETVVFSAEESLQEQQVLEQKRSRWKKILLGIILPVMFVLFFLIGFRQAGAKDAFLRDASPIIERLDMYLFLLDDDPDLELLRHLARQRTFLSPLPEGAPPIDPSQYLPSPHAHIPDSHRVAPGSLSEFKRRAKRIESLEGALASQFYWNGRKFLDDLGRAKQFQLKELHEAIVSAPRHHELFLTLENYYNWFKSLQSYEKTDLRKTERDPEKRAAHIAELKKRLETALDSSPLPTVSAADLPGSNEKNEIQELADVLRHLDTNRFEQTLNAPPDRAIRLLLQYYSEQHRHKTQANPSAP